MKYTVLILIFSFSLNLFSQSENFELKIQTTTIHIDINKEGSFNEAITNLDSLSKAQPNLLDSINRINISLVGLQTDLEKELSKDTLIKKELLDTTSRNINHELVQKQALKNQLIISLLNLFPNKTVKAVYFEKCFKSKENKTVCLRCAHLLIFLKN